MSSSTDLVSIVFDDHVVDLDQNTASLLKKPPVKLTIDGKEVEVPLATLSRDPNTGQNVARPTTIYDAAQKIGVPIPILCHREHMTPVAVCRFCVVDTGPGRLSAACHRQVEAGMEVKTAATSPRVKTSVKILTELLLADNNVRRDETRQYADNELRTIAKSLNLDANRSRFPAMKQDRGQDESSLVIAVDHNACILCDRCVRACGEIKHNEIIGRMGKGYTARISFDLNDPMGDSNCVSCGECMVSCPTGALTNRKVVKRDLWANIVPPPEPVSADYLYKHPLFEGVSKPFLKWNEGAVVRRTFKKGDIICREGDFGSTAFILEKGKVEVFIRSPLKHVKTRKDRHKGDKVNHGVFGLVRRFSSTLVGRREDQRPEENNLLRFIHIDAPVALSYDNPVDTLTPSDIIFGEMSCMNNYPRSATVRASEDVTLLEIQRNVLYILQRNKKSKELLDEVYRRRTVPTHLKSVEIFAPLQENPAEFNSFVEEFRRSMKVVRLNPGDTVFRQGDPADNFYLVRVGFIKVSQKMPGGEHVLSYVGPGGYFGEIGLLSHLPEIEGKAPPGVRTASCSALDHVDLIQISGEDFQKIISRFPSIKERLIEKALENLRQNELVRERTQNVPLGEFLKQGLMNARSLLVLDLEKCTRCDECTKACADTHDGVTRLVREGLRFDKYLVASSCRSCLDPYCMVGCPVDAIHRGPSREMIIEDWCIGCGTCSNNCPYGNINMHPFSTGETAPDPNNPSRQVAVLQEKATMCDLCSGLDGQPSCVYACPHDAAHRMTGADLIKDVENRMAARK
jgi:CRP-like cAMP-binding protein/Fe-S-cluster-containing hydrogenase component 2